LEHTLPPSALRRLQVQGAIEALRQAVHLNPEFTDDFADDGFTDNAVNRLGELYTDMKRWKEAIDLYQAAIKREPDNVARYAGLANVYWHVSYERLLAGQGKDTVAEARGKSTLAKALWITPERFSGISDRRHRENIARHYSLLASTLSMFNMHQEAAQAYRMGLVLTPNDALMRSELADQCLTDGDEVGALEQYEALKKLDPAKAEELHEKIKQ
jgi:tetratricopeptide (TPR) repeat protein